MTQTSLSKSASVRRLFSTGAAYFGAVIGLAAASLWFIADLKASSDRATAAQAAFDQLTEHSRPRPSASVASNASVTGSPFLDGRTVTIAGAALQERMSAAVAKAGGALISSQVELDGPEAKNGFVRLTATIEVGQPALQTILYDIEAGMPYLFIDKLSIQSPEDFGEPEGGSMRITIGVAGQWRRSE